MRALVRFGSGLLATLALVACSEAPIEKPNTTPTLALTQPFTGMDKVRFFGAPWPDDRRLENGTVPLLDFPNPKDGPLFANILEKSDRVLKGWGLNSPIYLPFSAAIDPASLPQAPTKDASASVYLMVVDPTSPHRGERTFIDFKFYAEPTLFLPANVLATRPVPGFPMEPKTKYALVVTSALKDAAGQPVQPDEAFQAVLAGTAPEAELTHYAPLFEELTRQGLPKTSVAAAVILTTQPIMEDLLAMRDFLLTFDSPVQAMDMSTLTVVTDEEALKEIWRGDEPSQDMWILQGTYKAPYMQHGPRPFLTEGGHFKFDSAGKPIPAFIEDMRVTICLPKGAPPANGFPPVYYSHGTGGDFTHAVGDICPELVAKGMIVFGIDQVLSLPRSGGANAFACFGQEVENCFFNYANPTAARANVQQAALDHVSLRRMTESLVIPADLHPEGHVARVDNSRPSFFGHSQGGLGGSLYTAIDPDLWGATLSGAGGHLSTSILKRRNPNAKELAEGNLFLNIAGSESLEPYHPALALAQTLVEIADPINYARHWFKRPNGRAKHIYMTSGLTDQMTVADAAEALAIAAGIPQIVPVGRKSDLFTLAGLAPVPAPTKQNTGSLDDSAKVTAVFRQFPREGHYPAFNNKSARQQWSTFHHTLVTEDAPTVPKPAP